MSLFGLNLFDYSKTTNKSTFTTDLNTNLNNNCKNVGTAVNSLDCSKDGGALIMNNSSISQETHLTADCALDGVTETLRNMALEQHGKKSTNGEVQGYLDLKGIGITDTDNTETVDKKVTTAVNNEIGSQITSINKITANACILNNSKIEQAHTTVMDAVLNASFINQDYLNSTQGGTTVFTSPLVRIAIAITSVIVCLAMIYALMKTAPQMMNSRRMAMAASKNVKVLKK